MCMAQRGATRHAAAWHTSSHPHLLLHHLPCTSHRLDMHPRTPSHSQSLAPALCRSHSPDVATPSATFEGPLVAKAHAASTAHVCLTPHPSRRCQSCQGHPTQQFLQQTLDSPVAPRAPPNTEPQTKTRAARQPLQPHSAACMNSARAWCGAASVRVNMCKTCCDGM